MWLEVLDRKLLYATHMQERIKAKDDLYAGRACVSHPVFIKEKKPGINCMYARIKSHTYSDL